MGGQIQIYLHYEFCILRCCFRHCLATDFLTQRAAAPLTVFLIKPNPKSNQTQYKMAFPKFVFRLFQIASYFPFPGFGHQALYSRMSLLAPNCLEKQKTRLRPKIPLSWRQCRGPGGFAGFVINIAPKARIFLELKHSTYVPDP